MLYKYISTLILTILSGTVFAQYPRATTISVLTNDSARKWQLGNIKTMGGCINETLIIEFKSDLTATFQYCNKGKWEPTSVHWQLLPGAVTNSWFIQFDTTLHIPQGAHTLDFDKNILTLKDANKHKKGSILLISKILPGNHLPAHISGTFNSKN